MSMSSGDIHLERLVATDYIRRVERDSEAKDFGQRQHGSRQSRHHLSEEGEEEEAPHDIIDVSPNYQAVAIVPTPMPVNGTKPPVALPTPRSKAHLSAPNTPAPSDVRHLDIEV